MVGRSAWRRRRDAPLNGASFACGPSSYDVYCAEGSSFLRYVVRALHISQVPVPERDDGRAMDSAIHAREPRSSLDRLGTETKSLNKSIKARALAAAHSGNSAAPSDTAPFPVDQHHHTLFLKEVPGKS